MSDASSLIDEARPLLDAELDRLWETDYQAFLAEEGKLKERELSSSAGNSFSSCTQVLRTNNLECALEVRVSLLHLHEDEVVPLGLGVSFRVTPDDQKIRL